MPIKLDPYPPAQRSNPETLAYRRHLDVCEAVRLLENARVHLRRAGASQARAYVAKALKSADGADRHAYARWKRFEWDRTAQQQKEATPNV
jgi:hypothetical protein